MSRKCQDDQNSSETEGRDDAQTIRKEERTIAAKSLSFNQDDAPFFALYHDHFRKILDSAPEIVLLAEKDHAWAHEAGVYIPEQDAVYITSNQIPNMEGTGKHIFISKVSRQSDGSWRSEVVPTNVPMGNGGINYAGGVLFCAQGTKNEPGGLMWMDVHPPYRTQTLIDSYHGRWFNSVNDVVVHSDGSIWFTDPIYGYKQKFRPAPQLPCQVYRFEPETGDVRVVADGFGRPNGLCFSPDERTMYITDTDMIQGDGSSDPMRAGTIYAFDVIRWHGSDFLSNRRVFAFADNGIPDGIKSDMEGNVYSGCGDGVNVWDAGGTLIGKIVVPGGVANFCFTRPGEMVMMNEKKLWLATISRKTEGALLAKLREHSKI